MKTPKLFERVEVPESFTPSRLAGMEDCRLRAVAERGSGRLIAGPWAPLGTVLHKLMEDAATGRIADGEDPVERASKHFGHLLAAEEARLSNDPAQAHFVPLSGAFSKLQWLTKTKSVIKQAAQVLASPSPVGGAPSTPQPPDFWKTSNGVGSEVAMESEVLRVHGTADWLGRNGDSITIRDFKTGTVLDEESEVVEHIQLQLRLYGLMALDAVPNAAVNLAVSKGADHPVGFGPAEIAATRDRLAELTAGLPPKAKLDADSLAKPGRACRWCSVRHRCRKYQAWAVEMWQGASEVTLPTDIWGEVTEVEDGPGGRNLRLRDAADRWVRVFRLSERHPEVAVGDSVRMFGLAMVKTQTRRGEAYRHPQNFHELPASSGQHRAWTLECHVAQPA